MEIPAPLTTLTHPGCLLLYTVGLISPARLRTGHGSLAPPLSPAPLQPARHRTGNAGGTGRAGLPLAGPRPIALGHLFPYCLKPAVLCARHSLGHTKQQMWKWSLPTSSLGFCVFEPTLVHPVKRAAVWLASQAAGGLVHFLGMLVRRKALGSGSASNCWTTGRGHQLWGIQSSEILEVIQCRPAADRILPVFQGFWSLLGPLL